MSTLTLGIIVIIYMFVIAWLGYLGYRQTKNASDYLLGGRKVNPIIMALSYGATFISASAIVGFGGVAATFGMGIQWLCLLNMFMGVVVAFIFFGRRTRKLGEAITHGLSRNYWDYTISPGLYRSSSPRSFSSACPSTPPW